MDSKRAMTVFVDGAVDSAARLCGKLRDSGGEHEVSRFLWALDAELNTLADRIRSAVKQANQAAAARVGS